MGSLLYEIFKAPVKLALRIAYSKIESKSLSDSVPDKGPVFIIANHQNALIDPLLICVESKRQISFLTRASAFKNPFVASILKHFNMLPVYRPRDSVDIRIANESVFEESIKRLCADGIIGIFPEGNHGGKRELRPLRKGYARMARMALAQGCDPYILPIGIDYSAHYSFNSRVIMHAGRGFYSSEIGDLTMDEQVFYNQMLVESRSRLLEVMLVAQSDLTDSILWRLDSILWDQSSLNSLEKRQAFLNKLANKEEEELMLLKSKIKAYQSMLRAVGRNHENLHHAQTNLFLRLPAIVGKLCMAPIRKLVSTSVEKLAEDPQFTATISFAIYLISIPLSIGLLLLVSYLFWGGWIASLVSILVLGCILTYRLAGKKQWALSQVSTSQLQQLDALALEIRSLLN